MRGLGLVVMCFAGLAIAAPRREGKTDTERLQGEWEVVAAVLDGEDEADWVKETKPKLTFKGDAYVYEAGANSEEGTFVLDPKAKTPTVDAAITKGNGKGKVQLGIYQLDGDNLKICFADEGAKTRPTRFVGKADAPEYFLLTLKRVKAK